MITEKELLEYLESRKQILCDDLSQRDAVLQYLCDGLGLRVSPLTADYLHDHPKETTYLHPGLLHGEGSLTIYSVPGDECLSYADICHLFDGSGIPTEEEMSDAFALLMSES